ncbi:MAG: hypothetical protein ACFFDC_11100 [Promethearchaeota archaeon]
MNHQRKGFFILLTVILLIISIITNNPSDFLIREDKSTSKRSYGFYHEPFDVTEYYNETYNETKFFTIQEGDLFYFNQCSSEEDIEIFLEGNGSLLIVNSNFYYIHLSGDLEIDIQNSTIVYTEISDSCHSILRHSIVQQYFAYDNTTSKLLCCYVSKLFDGSPILISISSGRMIRAEGYSRIILIEATNFPHYNVLDTDLSHQKISPAVYLWGVGPAGLIWIINTPLENEGSIEATLAGKVNMEIYVEGFNSHPTSRSENISAQLYVDDIPDQKTDVLSDDNNWNWQIPYQLDTTAYTLNNHTLRLFVNNSQAENWVSLNTQFIKEHALSKPIMVYPTGGERLDAIVTIEWRASNDSYNHSITYSLYYSKYQFSQQWRTLTTGISLTTYDWDTRVLPNRNSYRLKVVATCAEGLTAESAETGLFSINNTLTNSITTSPTRTSTEMSSREINDSSITTSHYSKPLLNFQPLLQFVGLSGVLVFIVTLVIITRRYQIE